MVANTGEAVLEALEIEGRSKVSFGDALILHAAERAGAAILYSENLAGGRTYGGVTAVNSFAGSRLPRARR